jgi:hypothetical protein
MNLVKMPMHYNRRAIAMLKWNHRNSVLSRNRMSNRFLCMVLLCADFRQPKDDTTDDSLGADLTGKCDFIVYNTQIEYTA